MQTEDPGHRYEGLVQDGLVGGLVNGLTGGGDSFRMTFLAFVVVPET